MKTHELARIFENIAKILKISPDSEVGDLQKLVKGKQSIDAIFENLSKLLKNAPNSEVADFQRIATGKQSFDSVGLGLKTLVQLSKLDKSHWVSLTEKYNFDIKLNPRDSSRDVIGKILRYLANNEEAYQEFEEKLNKTSGTSEPLENMLKMLLNQD